MTLNANKVPFTGGNKVTQPALEPGGYTARLVQVVALGLQPQEFKGEVKPPKYEIHTTYELSDEFCINEDGEVQEDRPRWISESFPLNPLKSERAKSTQRYLALDPKVEHQGDWVKLLGKAVMLNIVQNTGTGKNVGRIFNNISGSSPLRAKDEAKVPELIRDAVFFSIEEPDLEVFESLPDFIQDKIKSNLEYEGSVLQKLLGEIHSQPAIPEVEEEDVPW